MVFCVLLLANSVLDSVTVAVIGSHISKSYRGGWSPGLIPHTMRHLPRTMSFFVLLAIFIFLVKLRILSYAALICSVRHAACSCIWYRKGYAEHRCSISQTTCSIMATPFALE